MVVDGGRGRGLGHPRAQCGEVKRGAGLHPRDDDARHRQLVDRQSAAEPRLQQFCGFILAERADLDDARLRPHRVGDRGRIAVEIAAGVQGGSEW